MIQEQTTTNTLFDLAASYVNYTGRNLFLTGRAGTGKTTFLRHIQKTTAKNTVVVAPTGVAAINAGGVTMHSFFQLPLVPFVPEGKHQGSLNGLSVSNRFSLLQNIRFGKNKRELLRELELLIIDEVSMVRADMLDAIDTILRHFRGRPHDPFGGVQVLMIGDLFQLPPIVVAHEQELLHTHYSTPFFFDARVMQEAPPVCIELKKIYRQQDERFIDLLNKVRNNTVEDTDLEWLNSRYQPDFRPPAEEHYITLTSHNHAANRINESALKQLPGRLHRYEAHVSGEFNEKANPADKVLALKEGAQIMFIRNDKQEERRYYNGKIGVVQTINNDGIYVAFPDGSEGLWLEVEEWQNVRYKLNEAQKRVEEEVLGTFRQYPVRLAWAVTIHKSQGLTFDKAVVDAGASFTAGQVYVALSRLTSFDGLVLHSRIPRNSIHCDESVLSFMQSQQNETVLQQLLKNEQEAFTQNTLMQSFDWDRLADVFQQHLDDYKTRKVAFRDTAVQEASGWLRHIRGQKQTAKKFQQQLLSYLEQGATAYAQLHDRTQAATTYFIDHLQKDVYDAIEHHRKVAKGAGRTKKYQQALFSLQVQVKEKQAALRQALLLAEGLMKGQDNTRMLREISEQKKNTVYTPPAELKKKKRVSKGESQRTSLTLFKEGKTVAEIAQERGLANSTIEGHLVQFIRTGELSVFDLLPEEKINLILPLVEKSEDYASAPIKHQLGDACSYTDIRAVINHWLRLQSGAE